MSMNVCVCTGISETERKNWGNQKWMGMVVFPFKYVVFSNLCGCVFASFQVSVCE